MKTEYIGAFQVPDGYFGENAIIYLCFDPQTHCCLEIHATGYFRSCVPPATTKEEAEWLIRNHPASKGRFKTITKQRKAQSRNVPNEVRALCKRLGMSVRLYQAVEFWMVRHWIRCRGWEWIHRHKAGLCDRF